MITITFWNKDNDVHTIYDSQTFIYNEGDILYLRFDDVYPRKETELRKKYKDSFVDDILNDLENRRKKYHHHKYKITKIYKSISIRLLEEDHINIDVKVRKIRKIYWRFWRLYTWKQFWKNLLKKK